MSLWVRPVAGGWQLMVGIHEDGRYTESQAEPIYSTDEDALAVLRMLSPARP